MRNMNSSPRSASISNGAAAARRMSAPNASTSTRRRSISAKASAICPSSLSWARPFALTGQIGYAIPGSNATVDRRSRHRRHRHRIQSARSGLGRLAAIQPAVSEIRGGRSRPAGFRQSPDPAGRSLVADAGEQHLQLRHGDHRHHQSRRDLGRRQVPGRRRSDDPGQPPERHAMSAPSRRSTSSSTTSSPTPSAGRFSATASRQGGRRSATSHETFLLRSPSFCRNPASRRRACACHARPRQPACRQHGRHRAEGTDAVVHRKTGAGLFHRRGAQRPRRPCKAARRTSTAATAPSCACRSRRCRPGLTR